MIEMSDLQNKVYKMTKSELQIDLGRRGDKIDLIEIWLAQKLGDPQILDTPSLKELYKYNVMFREFSCSQLASMMRSRGISTREYNSKFELLRLWFSNIHDLSDNLDDVDFVVLHLNIDPHFLTNDEVSFIAKQCRSFPKSYLLASDVCRDKIYQNITGHPFAAGMSAFEEKLEIAQYLTEQRFASAFHCFENFDQLVKLSVEQLAAICKSFGLAPFENDKLSLIRTIILHSTSIVPNPASFEELQNWMLIVGNGDPTGMTLEELKRFRRSNETRDQVLGILNVVRQENEPLADQIEEIVGPVAEVARQNDQELRNILERIPVENVSVETTRLEPTASVLNDEVDDMIPRIVRFFIQHIKQIKTSSLHAFGSRQNLLAESSNWNLDTLRNFIGVTECRQVASRLGLKFETGTKKIKIFGDVVLRIQQIIADEIPLDVVEAIIQRYFTLEMRNKMAQDGIPILNLYVILNVFNIDDLRGILGMNGSKIKKEFLVDRVVKFYLDRYQADLEAEAATDQILTRSIGLDPFSSAAVINDEEVERALMLPPTPLLTQRSGPLKRVIGQVVSESSDDEDEPRGSKQLAIGPTLQQEMEQVSSQEFPISDDEDEQGKEMAQIFAPGLISDDEEEPEARPPIGQELVRVVRQESELISDDEDGDDAAQELADIRRLLNARFANEPASVEYRNFDEQEALELNTPANLQVAIRTLNGIQLPSDDEEEESSIISNEPERRQLSIRPVTPPILFAAEQILPREQADELQQIEPVHQFLLPQVVESNQPINERASIAPQPNILFRPRPPAPVVRAPSPPPVPVVRIPPPLVPVVRVQPPPVVRTQQAQPAPAPQTSIATRPPPPAQIRRRSNEMEWQNLPEKRRAIDTAFGEPEIKDSRRRITPPQPTAIFNPPRDQVAIIPPVELPATFIPPSPRPQNVEDSDDSEDDDFEEVNNTQITISIPQEEQEEESQAKKRFDVFFAQQKYTIASSFIDDMTSTEQSKVPNRFAQERDYLKKWREEPPFEDNDVEPMELENYMASLEQLSMQDLVELASRFGIRESTRNNMIFDIAQVKMPEFDARERIFNKNFANLFPFQLRCIADELHWNSFQPIEQIRNKLQVAARGKPQIVAPSKPPIVTPPRPPIVAPPRPQIVTPPRPPIVSPPIVTQPRPPIVTPPIVTQPRPPIVTPPIVTQPRPPIVTQPRPPIVTQPRPPIVTPPRPQVVASPRPQVATPRQINKPPQIIIPPRPQNVLPPRPQNITPATTSRGFVYSKPQSPLPQMPLLQTPPQVSIPAASSRGTVSSAANSRGFVYSKPQTPPQQTLPQLSSPAASSRGNVSPAANSRGIVYGKPQTPPRPLTILDPAVQRSAQVAPPPPQRRIDFSQAQQVDSVEQINIAPRQVQDIDWDEVFGPYVVL